MSDSPAMSARGRYLILTAAFLGWMFSGVQMTVMNLASGSVTRDFVRRGTLDESLELSLPRLLPSDRSRATSPPGKEQAAEIVKKQSKLWYARYNSAFLLGGAVGGLLFGWVGDRFGRVKAMALSIAWYSAFAGSAYFVATPEQLLLVRFVAAFGVGGMWPAGVSLATEAWSDVSRPTLSGLIGAAANVGIVLLSVVAYRVPVTADSWRWLMLCAATPILLAVWVWFAVPESPAWLAGRSRTGAAASPVSIWTVFQPPLLKRTILGIALGAIPLLGGWGVTAWMIPWAEEVRGESDPASKAVAAIMRASGATFGSVLGGWIANLVGRRISYFLISLTTLAIAETIYFRFTPTDGLFPHMVFLVGFVSTIFFGWLPLYLPELFPTASRATGTGVSFNFGRILTAIGVLGTGALTLAFGGFAEAGKVTSLVYALGMVVILFAPDTTMGKERGQGLARNSHHPGGTKPPHRR